MEEIARFNWFAVNHISSGKIKFLEKYIAHMRRLIDILEPRVSRIDRPFLILPLYRIEEKAVGFLSERMAKRKENEEEGQNIGWNILFFLP